MEGVDKERVQKIVYEMSKGSKYFENEQRKESTINQKIEQLHSCYLKLTENDISHFQMLADTRVLELEAMRDLSKLWLHVDMDAFYAAVETLENPSLRDKPLAVGSMSMICTANYEARRYGVRAAMPGFIARKLCPSLVFVPTNLKKYSHYSDLTRKVFSKYDSNFVAASLDEAYLDITRICIDQEKSGEEIAQQLRTGIFEATGLTCSAGVAPNRLLAKVCSDINKPNGQFVLPSDREAVMTFISSLPIRKISGIGKVTEQVLRHALGIQTCEEMLRKRAFIFALFSSRSADFFLSVGLGIGATNTPSWRPRKSISTERTFSTTTDEAMIYQKLANVAETLSSDMQEDGLCGRTLTLKLKTASFEVRTRALSLQRYIFSKDDILAHAYKLLKAELPVSLRLIGLRMSHLNEVKLAAADPMQKTLSSYMISDGISAKDAPSSTCGDVREDFHKDDPGVAFPIENEDSFLSDTYINEMECLSDLADQSDLDISSKNLILCDASESLQNLQSGHSMEQLKKNELPVNEEINVLGAKDTVLSEMDGQPFWIDDSRCSFCGFELPPSFFIERQEHLDYHLAEVLQKEESQHVLAQRTPPKHRPKRTKESGRKKHKSSLREVKHIPIDFFFAKEKQ
ncbi:DNA polymerase kappa isoform X2 [Nymphaea colorata]|nr:DNA polymerase kappa isoform X2 [Nymphaea colorata]XP_031490871.1 DNA polymerase kappa isoform X2 [Nymphaea colorata]XP_031490872.1 DNA polymerase kappa isoform X2 [Nymphaea colorata]